MSDEIPSIRESFEKIFKKKQNSICACPYCGKIIEVRKVE